MSDELFDEIFGDDKSQLNLNQRPNVENDRGGSKKGNLLFDIIKPKSREEWAERVVCGKCGTSFDREKNHEWKSTLARRFKLKVDQCFIYCSCGEKIYEMAAPDFVKDIVGVQNGEYTTTNNPVLQIDSVTDTAVKSAYQFLVQNKEKISVIQKQLYDNESKVSESIREIFKGLQIVAAYYSRQTPGAKILQLNGFSFSPKDGIGKNGGHGSYSDYGMGSVLSKIRTLTNLTIDGMKIHPRLKEILRAMKIQNYYITFFNSSSYYHYEQPTPKINTSDINYIFNELMDATISFKEERTYNGQKKVTGSNDLRSMGLNQRLKYIYNYVDHHNREKLAYKNFEDVVNLHFANEFFILLKLKYAKKQYQKRRR